MKLGDIHRLVGPLFFSLSPKKCSNMHTVVVMDVYHESAREKATPSKSRIGWKSGSVENIETVTEE